MTFERARRQPSSMLHCTVCCHELLHGHDQSLRSLSVKFDLTLQRWDAPKQEIENGVYLGHIASISFLGPWAMTSVSLALISGHDSSSSQSLAVSE